jgi:TonB family protein
MFAPIAAALFVVLQAPLSHPAPEVPIVTWQTSLKGAVTETDGPLLRLGGGSGWSRSLVPELDYVLRLQYRLATPDAHGAVLVRAVSRRSNSWADSGYRVVLGSSPTLPDGSVVTLSRESGTMRAHADIQPTSDAWHDLEITCRGNHVVVRIDNIETASLDGDEPIAGAVGLEHSAGTLEFRNIRYQALPSPPWSDAVAIDRPDFAGTKPRALKMAQPNFKGAKGTLVSTTELLIGVDGAVQGVRLTKSSEPDFDAAALAAAWKWQFTPAVVNGHPVPVIVKIDMTYGGR